MLKDHIKQQTLYSILYHRIPEKHILKLIDKFVDFSFINNLLAASYCKYYGRPAKEPEMMAKLSMLQYLYNLSDQRVIEETAVNLAFMWFIGVNPEDDLPDPSLLCKFRTQRLQETNLDAIITEVVRQCISKGIIKGTGISVDCTHAEANTQKKFPERIIKNLAKNIHNKLKQEQGAVSETINTEIPNYKAIEDHQQAKIVMKQYVEELIDQVKEQVNLEENPLTKSAIEEAEEVLNDPKFIQQKGIRSLVDKDARVGYKSKSDSFYGYKVEFTMIAEERIITGIKVHDGAYVDGTYFEKLLYLSQLCDVDIQDVLGDKAYFRKPILDAIKNIGAQAYIPVSESVYKIDESKFKYNKDSDEWFCENGNRTVRKKKKKRKNGSEFLTYYFEKETCRNCPKRDSCINGTSIAKRLDIGVNTPEFYVYSQWAKSEEFREKYKSRASQEWKNGEMKRFHGLDRARGYGLRSMQIQSKLTALAVNLKRIAKLASSLNHFFYNSFCKIKRRHLLFSINAS
jgi:transposase